MPDDAAVPRPLRYGEAIARVFAWSNRNPRFALGALGGRFVLLCVTPTLHDEETRAAMHTLAATSFDERERLAALFCTDDNARNDLALASTAPDRLGFCDSVAARTCGLLGADGAGRWILIDPSLRALAFWPLAEAAAAIAALARTPEPGLHAGAPLHAPVLIAPRIFEPDFCNTLIAYYRQRGGAASGVTQQNDEGKTIVRLDDAFKKRADCLIEAPRLRDAIMQRIYWRLAPEIEKAFMWRPTRMERYLVACYDAENGGFFKPHRDNTTGGTAHRRFAVTINLNANAYEGGDLRFPEFGARTYRAPTGGAVVFSCALLHEATPVTVGQRYAFLPFLYDDAAAKLRADNNRYLDESIAPYRAE